MIHSSYSAYGQILSLCARCFCVKPCFVHVMSSFNILSRVKLTPSCIYIDLEDVIRKVSRRKLKDAPLKAEKVPYSDAILVQGLIANCDIFFKHLNPGQIVLLFSLANCAHNQSLSLHYRMLKKVYS